MDLVHALYSLMPEPVYSCPQQIFATLLSRNPRKYVHLLLNQFMVFYITLDVSIMMLNWELTNSLVYYKSIFHFYFSSDLAGFGPS